MRSKAKPVDFKAFADLLQAIGACVSDYAGKSVTAVSSTPAVATTL